MTLQPAPAAMDHRHRWLAGCVLLSALLHGMVLYGWRPAPSAPVASPVPPVRIALVERVSPASAVVPVLAPVPAPNPAPTVRPVPRPAPLPRRSTPPVPPAQTAAASIPQAAPDTAPASPAAAAPAPDPALTRQRLMAHMRLELARHFHYPPLAARRGWQGTVLLGFRIGTHGAIEAIHVAESSGHATLDRAALGALAKVAPLSLERELDETLELQLPVIYRLEES